MKLLHAQVNQTALVVIVPYSSLEKFLECLQTRNSISILEPQNLICENIEDQGLSLSRDCQLTFAQYCIGYRMDKCETVVDHF